MGLPLLNYRGQSGSELSNLFTARVSSVVINIPAGHGFLLGVVIDSSTI